MPKDLWARARARDAARRGVRDSKPKRKRKKAYWMSWKQRRAANKPAAQAPRQAEWYEIKAGTDVEVRKLNTGTTWKSHRTTKTIRCHGFLWRNMSHYGFAQANWEVKVRVGSFRPVWESQP